jgi:hypothetical protein
MKFVLDQTMEAKFRDCVVESSMLFGLCPLSGILNDLEAKSVSVLKRREGDT